ncbi:peptidase inhibitor family I36 protein [Streptomyces atroolivaceus]|uniref:Peptidase inhibitor family I36 protein n=1 Tax=Streptomyces atroolivaceus TaxID=66869 RepID=A0ABV9V746_STRAZ|nr:peptidase inhibitor family I36 protein [Streptomyces atroolivaceus]
MNRITALAATAVVLAFGLGTGPVSATDAGRPAVSEAAAPAAAFARCTHGYFCAFDGWNGEGTRCQWSAREMRNTADNCSFIREGRNVLSVWNKTEHRVQYYTQTNFNSRVGSTLAGQGGNLQGNYQIRSFKPQ